MKNATSSNVNLLLTILKNFSLQILFILVGSSCHTVFIAEWKEIRSHEGMDDAFCLLTLIKYTLLQQYT